jgi:hypothetical protein
MLHSVFMHCQLCSGAVSYVVGILSVTRFCKWKCSVLSRLLSWNLLFVCIGHLDKHTAEVCLWTEPSWSGTAGCEIPVMFCQQSILVDWELVKQVLNAFSVPWYVVWRSQWDSAVVNYRCWSLLCILFCKNNYNCMYTACSFFRAYRRQSAVLWLCGVCSESASRDCRLP